MTHNGDTSPARQRVLMTGGAGFIGANLARMLLEHDYQITVLDDMSSGQRAYLNGLPVSLVEGDILDAELAKQLAAEADAIVHLAAQPGIVDSIRDPRRNIEINVLGLQNLLEASRCAQDPSKIAFIFASSNAALGRQPPPATEDKAPLPVSPYGASKLAGEAYCMAYHHLWGIKTLSLRFANVYGPFSAHKSTVVSRFFQDALSNGQVTIYGDGSQTRDFLHVNDLCKAILTAIESDMGGEVFQIATGMQTSVLELAALMQQVVGKDFGISHQANRAGDVSKNYSSIEKARQMLGWEPEMPLLEGLQDTWRWFNAWAVASQR